MLLQHKVNCDSKNNHGDTALMVAASAGMSNVVRLLIDAGADRNLRNKKRKTAADIAAATGHLVIAQMLK
jgi:uncharacterized protein